MDGKIAVIAITVLAVSGCSTVSNDEFQGDPVEVQKTRVACAKVVQESSPSDANIYSNAGARNAKFYHCMEDLGYPLKNPNRRFF